MSLQKAHGGLISAMSGTLYLGTGESWDVKPAKHVDALTAAKLRPVVVHHRKVITPPYPTVKQVMLVKLLQHAYVGQVSHLSALLFHIFMQAEAYSTDLPLEQILLAAMW